MKYKLKIFIKRMPGYYQYEIGDVKDQAIDHMTNVVRDGYRRVDERGQMVHYMPSIIEKVVLHGPELNTEYTDELLTT